jgi:hypothetical protein
MPSFFMDAGRPLPIPSLLKLATVTYRRIDVAESIPEAQIDHLLL